MYYKGESIFSSVYISAQFTKKTLGFQASNLWKDNEVKKLWQVY